MNTGAPNSAHNWPTGCPLCGNQNCHNGDCQSCNAIQPLRPWVHCNLPKGHGSAHMYKEPDTTIPQKLREHDVWWPKPETES